MQMTLLLKVRYNTTEITCKELHVTLDTKNYFTVLFDLSAFYVTITTYV